MSQILIIFALSFRRYPLKYPVVRDNLKESFFTYSASITAPSAVGVTFLTVGALTLNRKKRKWQDELFQLR